VFFGVVTVEPSKGGGAEKIEADVVLVSIGRRAHTDGLALDKAGLATNDRGVIETDHNFRTSVPSIWAAMQGKSPAWNRARSRSVAVCCAPCACRSSRIETSFPA